MPAPVERWLTTMQARINQTSIVEEQPKAFFPFLAGIFLILLSVFGGKEKLANITWSTEETAQENFCMSILSKLRNTQRRRKEILLARNEKIAGGLFLKINPTLKKNG